MALCACPTWRVAALCCTCIWTVDRTVNAVCRHPDRRSLHKYPPCHDIWTHWEVAMYPYRDYVHDVPPQHASSSWTAQTTCSTNARARTQCVWAKIHPYSYTVVSPVPAMLDNIDHREIAHSHTHPAPHPTNRRRDPGSQCDDPTNVDWSQRGELQRKGGGRKKEEYK